MNRRPQGLKASKAVVGFLQYKGAEGLAPITVAGYERDDIDDQGAPFYTLFRGDCTDAISQGWVCWLDRNRKRVILENRESQALFDCI
jgi:hypothetical protein